MNDFDDSYRAMPVGVIAASFAVTMLVDFMPFPFDVFFWLPELTALMLLYWSMHHPQRVGMGIAFLLGLIVDAATAATLGLHALSHLEHAPSNHALRPHHADRGGIGSIVLPSGGLGGGAPVPQQPNHHLAKFHRAFGRRAALAFLEPVDAGTDQFLSRQQIT